MSALEQVDEAAAGGQPSRIWELERLYPRLRRYVRAGDGYRVEVWFTGAGAVRKASVSSPGGQRRFVFHGDSDKLERVLAWFADPAAAFGPRQEAAG